MWWPERARARGALEQAEAAEAAEGPRRDSHRAMAAHSPARLETWAGSAAAMEILAAEGVLVAQMLRGAGWRVGHLKASAEGVLEAQMPQGAGWTA